MKQTFAPIYLNTEIYFSAPLSVVFWEGISSTPNEQIFYISGTSASGEAALYKGPLEILDNYPIYNFVYPGSTDTNAYGTRYLKKDYNDLDVIRIVGSYEFSANPEKQTFAYVFTGTVEDLNNPNKFTQIIPFKNSKFTVAHSTDDILAVYVVSDVSPTDIFVGECAIYDIVKNTTLTQIKYPGSFSTTSYGIWYNGIDNGYQSYTITGGFSIVLGVVNSYVVDFLYNPNNGEYYFTNWTEIKVYKDAKLESHVQGITRLNNGNYVCVAQTIFNETGTGINSLVTNSMGIEIKRTNDTFVIVDYTIYDYPNGTITALTSTALNTVVGAYTNKNNKIIPFQALTLKPINN